MRHHAISLLFSALAVVVPAQGAVRGMTHHATGSFEVSMNSEAQDPGPVAGVPTSRMGLSKTFSGALEGTATGTMLAAGTPKPGAAAAYVAIDQFTGKLEDRSGGFVLVHRGTMTKAGEADLQVIVAPDSGTGRLEGIAGTLTIRMATAYEAGHDAAIVGAGLISAAGMNLFTGPKAEMIKALGNEYGAGTMHTLAGTTPETLYDEVRANPTPFTLNT